MEVVHISESGLLPISSGKIEVDTTKGAVTIFMKSCPRHDDNESLIITKISNDSNTVSLFSESSLINGAEIIIFGLPSYAKLTRGKSKTLIMKSDGRDWKIIKEE